MPRGGKSESWRNLIGLEQFKSESHALSVNLTRMRLSLFSDPAHRREVSWNRILVLFLWQKGVSQLRLGNDQPKVATGIYRAAGNLCYLGRGDDGIFHCEEFAGYSR